MLIALVWDKTLNFAFSAATGRRSGIFEEVGTVAGTCFRAVSS